MRSFPVAVGVVAVGVTILLSAHSDPAEARCRVWQATHNGSGLFYPRDGGAAGTAANKLKRQVQKWKKQAGVETVQIGRITTSCGERFVKYLLPHRHCTARARVCY